MQTLLRINQTIVIMSKISEKKFEILEKVRTRTSSMNELEKELITITNLVKSENEKDDLYAKADLINALVNTLDVSRNRTGTYKSLEINAIEKLNIVIKSIEM